MNYIDNEGNIRESESGQDKLLKVLYGKMAGRLLLKILVRPFISKIGGWILNKKISSVFIKPFVDKNGIDLKQYEQQKFSSYNSFFTRKIRKENRHIDMGGTALISPCDGKLSAFPIDRNSRFHIKHTGYSLEDLLHSRKLADLYNEGTACIIRLTVDDYHRYCYMDDGIKTDNYRIPGIFHTVNPIACETYPIYKQNTREFCILQSKNFGNILVMEVGALLVGKINNYHRKGEVKKGQEKGRFEFGGSTIVVLLQKGKSEIDKRFFENTVKDCETLVKMGEKIGCAVK